MDVPQKHGSPDNPKDLRKEDKEITCEKRVREPGNASNRAQREVENRHIARALAASDEHDLMRQPDQDDRILQNHTQKTDHFFETELCRHASSSCFTDTRAYQFVSLLSTRPHMCG